VKTYEVFIYRQLIAETILTVFYSKSKVAPIKNKTLTLSRLGATVQIENVMGEDFPIQTK